LSRNYWLNREINRQIMKKTPISEIDNKIISLIEQDGRATYRDIAKLLGISERQAGMRLRNLIDDDVIGLITVVDAFAIGFKYILALGVQVADRPALEVAELLAELPNVIASAVMTGQYDIEIMIAVEDHAELLSLVQRELADIPGISSLHPSLFLDVVKYETGAGPVPLQPSKLTIPKCSSVDDVDATIIEQLWKNASATNEHIATELGVSESTVRKRMARLRADGLIHITAIRNVAIGKDVVFASIGIELSTSQHRKVVEKLCSLRQVHFVAHVLGRYDIIAQVLAENTMEISDLVNNVIGRIPGVRSANCALALEIVKYDHRWRILGPVTGR